MQGKKAQKRPYRPSIAFAMFLLCLPACPAGTETGTKKDDGAAKSNLDYWLKRGTEEASGDDTPTLVATPFGNKREFSRKDALPGVIAFSDGAVIPGGVYTTAGKDWELWVEKYKRWIRIPPAAVLSITAKVVEASMELRWRWKAMGEPEKVYTGEKYPMKRFLWTFRLADGRSLTGAIKGQPVWVEPAKDGPTRQSVLRERMKGDIGGTLEDLVYPEKIVISRKTMETLLSEERADDTTGGGKESG